MKVAFNLEKIKLPLTAILPVRQMKPPSEHAHRYKVILASIKEVGLVEPLVIFPQAGAPGKYLLLDGHERYYILKQLEIAEADCIVAKDDECFTYNARVSRMVPIQEHKMIMRAVKDGVSPERIAAALNKPVRVVKASMSLLDGIHDEAADILKDKSMAPKAIRMLRKVTGVRQIEIAELMVNANNFTAGYAEALVFSTPQDQLTHPTQPKQKVGLTAEDIARMEEEMETLQQDLSAVQDTYGENMLNLTCARGYIKKLLENAKIVRFLNSNFPEIAAEFEKTAVAEGL